MMVRNIAEFMTEAAAKFYSKADIFGEEGDFITAPEMSQLFGEMLGAWVAFAWERNNRPNPVQLVELGPGTGVMMADMLRTLRHTSPDLFQILRVVMVDNSAELSARQRQTLKDYPNIQWIQDIRELPDIPFILVANEFFDCLPIHQLVKTEQGLRERMVDGNRFVVGQDEPSYLLPYLAREHIKSPEGSIIEVCPYAVAIIGFLTERMKHNQSSALIIDYGYVEPQVKETLQAISKHKFCSILSEPGTADITAHVDFSALRAAAVQSKAKVYGPVPQGLWLQQLGIEERAQKLMAAASPEDRDALEKSLHQLLSDDEMGKLFKVMVIYSKR